MEDGVIELYNSYSQVMNDAIDRVVVKVHNYKQEYNKKSILMTGCNPACGVTTLAIHLASALSLSGWKTLLVDCDLRKGNQYKRLGRDIEFGLANYLSKKASLEQITNKTNLELLDYISCGSMTRNAVRLLCSSDMTKFMETSYERYDYIIFDMPSLSIVPDATILFPYVDGIILVAALHQTTKKQLWDSKQLMEKTGDKYYGLLINQVDMGLYEHSVKDYDYFRQDELDKRYKKNVKKAKKKRGKTLTGGIS